MAPTFALDLSLDGIRLLYRADGGWTVVGDVALEDPGLRARLAAFRADAEDIAPGAVTTELVIPPSQIRYATVPRPAAEPLTEADLVPVIEGLTPLAPEELVFDWEVEGDTVRLALVDRTTLNEAETFAEAHAFNPVSFGARPTPAQFPRPPQFGPTARALRAAAPKEPAAAPPPPAARPAEPAPTAPEAVAAETLARSLSAPRPAAALRALRPQATRARVALPPPRRLAVAAGGGLAAILALAVLLGRGEDPAASLPDTPPEVAVATPALGAPDTGDAGPAAPSAPAEAAPVSVTAAAVPAPATEADPAADPATDTSAPVDLAAEAAPGPAAIAAPAVPRAPRAGTTEEIYFASIDPVTRASDAVALLPAAVLAAAPRPAAPLPPPPAGTSFDFAADGLVVATPGGALTPDGIRVTLGPPPLLPPAAPARAAEAPAAPAAVASALPDVKPRARPADLVERTERAIFGGRTRAEFAALRPAPRPASPQAAAVAEAPAAPTDAAVTASLVPRDRPADLATRVATANAVAEALANAPPEPAPAPAPAPEPAPAPQVAAAAPPQQAPAASAEDYDDGEPEAVAAAPRIPTSASVARQATIENAIRLRDLNLIGVYGTERDRRALVRLPSGRFVKVQVGDRLDGGQIAAIGRDELRYVKGGRNITLTVPSG